MSIFQKLTHLPLRQKLMIAVLCASLLPLAAVSFLSTNKARSAMETQAFNQLESLREVKKSQIEDYFTQIRDQIITFSEQDTVVNAMTAFRSGFESLPRDLAITQRTLRSRRESVSNYYRNAFGAEYETQTGKSLDTGSLIPDNASSILAQYLYIANNVNEVGNKEKLDFATDGSAYSKTHAKYHPQFRNFLQKFGYYDIFLVDANSGDIVYSVFKEVDYSTSLLSGPYANTNFARAFNEAKRLGARDSATLVDFETYLPSYESAASFIASPIYNDGTLAGVLIFQMPVGEINAMMQQRSGLGESGEAYLVGADFKMRSQSRFVEHNTILTQSVETEATRAVINGETDARIIPDYRGTPVLSSFTPLAITGLNWGLLAKIDAAEAFAPVNAIMWLTALLAAAGAAFAALIAVLVARNVLHQLGADPGRLLTVTEAIAGGNLETDLATATPASGVFAAMQKMQRHLRKRATKDKSALVESTRLKSALDNVQANVMMADANLDIIYVNETIQTMFRDAEADLRTVLPGFSASDLVGKNIDIFHKNPVHQRSMLGALSNTFEGDISIANRYFNVIATPVFGSDGERLGTVAEWADRTQEINAEQEINQIVAAVLEGDLTRRIDMQSKTGFFEVLGKGVNGIIEKLANAMGGIGRTSSQVRSGAEEIAQGNANLSQRTEEQAASLEETASSMAEMTSTVKQNADAAAEANTLAAGARDKAEQGGAVVSNAVSAMDEITTSSKKISNIIGTIDEIAFQTNLLALNASVEAARAGEQGRGFAVVASEVRNLAGRSANAAKEIKDLIEDSVSKVENGTRLVNESGNTLAEIVTAIRQVTDIVGNIATASREQSTGIDEVNRAITQMDEMTQQNAALVEEIAASSESMRQHSDELTEMVNQYSIGADSNGATAERRSGGRAWAEKPPTATAAAVDIAVGGKN